MKPIFCALLLGAFLIPSYGAAQTAVEPTAVCALSNAELAARIDSLQAKTSTWGKIVANLPKISGYLQLGYQWSETSSDFFIKRARMSFSGDIYRDKLDYRLQLEFASSPKIVDAYLRYKPFGGLNFQLGEYKIPFLLENPDCAPLKLEFIEYSMVVTRLVGLNDVCGISGATGRDIGAMIFGGFVKRDGYYLINYNVSVFNGEGINLRDQNRSKDVVGRLTLQPIKNLQLSGSYYWGEYGKDYLKRIRYGAGAAYDGRLGVLRGEYIRGITGEMISEGWFAVAGWRFCPKFMAAVRVEAFMRDIELSQTRQKNYAVALTWQPIKYLRCQVEYTFEDHFADGVANRNVVGVMLSGAF